MGRRAGKKHALEFHGDPFDEQARHSCHAFDNIAPVENGVHQRRATPPR